MEIYHSYNKLRKEFGRHAAFSDEAAEVLADIRPDDAIEADYINRNPVTTNVQVVPVMSENHANTDVVHYAATPMQHTEGGWPKDIDFTELEHTQRFKKKVEKDEDYIKSISGLGVCVEELIKQNNAIDIYEEYFAGAIVDHSAEKPDYGTITSFQDPEVIKRQATYLSWHPDGASKVAVAYSCMEFQGHPEGMSEKSFIWDVANPNVPDFTFAPPSQMCCVNYNTKDQNILSCGQYNGQVAYFDTRKGAAPVDQSPIEFSHRDPVYDMAWMQSKTGTECMSTSTDGFVFFWDTRRLGEPIETLELKVKGSEDILGAVSLEYEAAAGPTKFMLGTEQGTVLMCNRKAKNPQDRIGSSYPGHHGPVYSLERNPFYPKFFISVGDWTARVWMEDLKTPIMTTKYHSSYLTGGTWSPQRPGVFFSIKMNGELDVWDFFYKQNEPTLTINVTDTALTSFNIQESGKLVTVGDSHGKVALLDLCDGLAVMQQNEKQSISQMFEREAKREKNLEARAKELKQARARAAKEASAQGEADNDEAAEAALLGGVESAFWETTKLPEGQVAVDDRSALDGPLDEDE